MRRLPFSTLFHLHPTGLSPALRRSSTKIPFLRWLQSQKKVELWQSLLWTRLASAQGRWESPNSQHDVCHLLMHLAGSVPSSFTQISWRIVDPSRTADQGNMWAFTFACAGGTSFLGTASRKMASWSKSTHPSTRHRSSAWQGFWGRELISGGTIRLLNLRILVFWRVLRERDWFTTRRLSSCT